MTFMNISNGLGGVSPQDSMYSQICQIMILIFAISQTVNKGIRGVAIFVCECCADEK